MEYLLGQNSYSKSMNPYFNNVNSNNIIGVNNSKIYACSVNNLGVIDANASPCFANFVLTALGTYTCTFNVVSPVFFANAPKIFIYSKQAHVTLFNALEVYECTTSATGCVVNCYIAGNLAGSSVGFNVLLIGN